jgi:hypothetical protein
VTTRRAKRFWSGGWFEKKKQLPDQKRWFRRVILKRKNDDVKQLPDQIINFRRVGLVFFIFFKLHIRVGKFG